MTRIGSKSNDCTHAQIPQICTYPDSSTKTPGKENLDKQVHSLEPSPPIFIPVIHEQAHSGTHYSLKKGLLTFGETGKEAARKELEQMKIKKVWQYIREEERNSTPLRAIMTFKEKLNPDGTLIKIMARLVADGSTQEPKLYEDGSPTIKASSVKMILKIAATEKRRIRAIDISGAYLNADMDEEVLLLLNKDISQLMRDVDPESMQHTREDGSIIVKLKKALYGCKQSAHLWYEHL